MTWFIKCNFAIANGRSIKYQVTELLSLQCGVFYTLNHTCISCKLYNITILLNIKQYITVTLQEYITIPK